MPDRRPQVVDPQDHHHSKVTTSSSVAMQARNKMPLLPAEIIFAICRCFTVDPHNPAKGFHVSLSARDNIRTLRQLSLTCRAVHDVVTPALYNSIYFTGPRTDPDLPVPTDRQNPGAENLVYFLRTILQNSKLRQHVRDLACLIDLRDACDFEEEMNTPNKDYGILSAIRDCKDTETKRLLDVAESWITRSWITVSRVKLGSDILGFGAAFGTNSCRPIISVSHQAFALIICLLPNLDSISMQTGTGGLRHARYCNRLDWNPTGPIGRSDSRTAQHDLLQNLRTLQVQCEPHSHVPSRDYGIINVREMIPILKDGSNAFKLTHFRGFGYSGCWSSLPNALTSFERWGPLSDLSFISKPLLNLKSMRIHLVPSPESLHLDLNDCCAYLSREAPALEHLEVSLSPGTRTDSIWDPLQLGIRGLNRLQSFSVDTYFISDGDWAESSWAYLGGVLNALPPNIQTLRLVDSEPKQLFNTTLNWVQVITRTHLRPENLSKLKRVEFLHMPSLVGANRNAGSWSSSQLANEVKQELALNGVQFQLCVNGRGCYLEQEDILA